jgi:hypothetical protein
VNTTLSQLVYPLLQALSRTPLKIQYVYSDYCPRSDLTSIQVRQLAAVELRKRVQDNSGELWLQLPQNEREEIKSKLPELVLADNRYVLDPNGLSLG